MDCFLPNPISNHFQQLYIHPRKKKKLVFVSDVFGWENISWKKYFGISRGNTETASLGFPFLEIIYHHYLSSQYFLLLFRWIVNHRRSIEWMSTLEIRWTSSANAFSFLIHSYQFFHSCYVLALYFQVRSDLKRRNWSWKKDAERRTFKNKKVEMKIDVEQMTKLRHCWPNWYHSVG